MQHRLIGQHMKLDEARQKVWDQDIVQIFMLSPQYFLTNQNWQFYASKFSQPPEDYNGKGKIVIIHTSYVSVIQSEKENVQEKSWKDFYYLLLMCKIFEKVEKVYINMHIRSNHELNEERLLKLLKDSAPKNVTLLFEHESSDNFEKFIEKFKHLREKGIGFTFDTAHIFGAGVKPENIKKIAGDVQPTLIHLNGSQCPFNSHRDVHVPICSEFDNVFNEKTLQKFLADYPTTPIIIEARNNPDYYNSKKLVEKIEKTQAVTVAE